MYRRTSVPSPTRPIHAVVLALLLSAAPGLGGDALAAQDGPRWERASGPTEPGPTLFHATQAMNLPTAETAGAGEFLFEISHRFVPAISTEDTFLGIDGPVRYRLGLSYGITDRVMVGLHRSNLDDNLDLGARFRFWETGGPVPLKLAVAGGLVWNTEVPGLVGSSRQAHGQLILNVGLTERLALGLIPAVVSNPRLRAADEDAAVSLGIHGQVYLTEVVSLVGEWTVTEDRPGLPNDPVSLAVELETGGHFFRVGVTNSLRLNPSQYLVGAGQPFEPDEWRWGFNISRVLAF